MKFIKLLSLLPFIKAIYICNTLAYLNCPEDHDIDLFIITEKNRIWTARFWVAAILKLFKLRPSPKKSKDTLCPSFFVSEENLNLEKVKIQPNDIYLHYWILQVCPIFDPKNTYYKFQKENSWIYNNKNIEPIKNIPAKKRIIIHGPCHKSIKIIIKPIAMVLSENFYKKIEMNALPENLKKMANKDTKVIIKDDILKFHDNDRRKHFYELWLKKLEIYSK